jgi:hypothetical protein
VRVTCGMTTEDHTPMLSVCGMRSRCVLLSSVDVSDDRLEDED